MKKTNHNAINSYYSNQRSEVADFLPYIPNDAKILEIGCGIGSFKKNIKINCEYWGVEPLEEIGIDATKNLDKVLIGKFEDIKDVLPNNYFDCIICCDVIEHMKDEEFFFKEIKNKLKKNGYIIGSIPNIRYVSNLIKLIILKDWQYVNEGILDKTHLRFFTKKSIKRIIKNNDYKIEILRGINENKLDNLSFRKFFKKILFDIFCLIIGEDCKYMQFVFVIKK